MPQDFGAKPNAIPWPPLIYAGALLVAWILERFDAWTWLDSSMAAIPMWLGGALFAAGLALDAWAIVMLRRKKTPVLPTAPAVALVTGGPYRFTRNPIYLGNTIALAGFAIAVRWGWLVLLIPATIAAVNWLAISREEEHLERRFGEEWRHYAAKVRRWV